MTDRPRTPDQRRDGLMRLFNDVAPIAKLFGMTLSYDGDAAVFDMPYNPALDHALGGTHGGAIATLLDNAGWFTVAPAYDTWVATVEFQTRLHRPTAGSHLRARGRVVKQGKRLSSADMEVRDAAGHLVATGSGTFAVTSVEMDWEGLSFRQSEDG